MSGRGLILETSLFIRRRTNSGDKFICPEKDEEWQDNPGTWIIYPEKDAHHTDKIIIILKTLLQRREKILETI